MLLWILESEYNWVYINMFCETFASFFDQKINSIKAAIASKLAGNNSDALRADGAFNGEPLRDLQPPHGGRG